MMKLIVDVAKVDWPHFYPGFFPQILQLIHTQVGILAVKDGGLITARVGPDIRHTIRFDGISGKACRIIRPDIRHPVRKTNSGPTLTTAK